MQLGRLVASLLALALAAAPARAETEKAPPPAEKSTATRSKAKVPPYRLVRILPETGQALLLDRNRGRHVLVDVGEALGGYEVTEIGADHIVLARAGDAREFVLVAGEAPTSRVVDPYPSLEVDPAPAPASPLLDPYPPGVLDPYGSEGVREVQAPPGQRGSELPPPPPTPPVVVDIAPPKPEAPPPTSFTVTRGELEAGLSDFARIGREVQMSVTPGGVKLERVGKESFFHTMGLRAGDVVKKVDGTPIQGLDDAARVYARLRKAKKFTVEIERGGAPQTLRYQVGK